MCKYRCHDLLEVPHNNRKMAALSTPEKTWHHESVIYLCYVRIMRPVNFPRLKRRDPLKQDFGLDNNLRRVEE